MTTTPYSLTDRELHILQLIADGQTTKAIAGTVNLSPKTVEYHRASLMAKLKVHDIPALLSFALKHNLMRQKPSTPPSIARRAEEGPIQSVPDLAQALLRGASDAAAGRADVLQINALCQCSDALIRLARLQLEATTSDRRIPWLSDSSHKSH